MVICLPKEPQNLFLFSSGQVLAPAIQSALYGGSIGASHLNILDSLLDSQLFDSTLQPTLVQAGEPMVDGAGNPTALSVGTQYRPAGCQTQDCVQTYAGDQPVEMDVWRLHFTLRAGLVWSDGAPLTADD